MLRTPPALLALLLLPCCTASEPQVGAVNTCLYADDEAIGASASEVTVRATGVVVADEPSANAGGYCGAVATRALTLDGDDGVQYVMGYGFADADGVDLTVALPVVTGDAVDLLFRFHQPFGTAAGFVLSEGGSPVAALEMGTFGPGLEDGDVPGLTVTAGAATGVVRQDCGSRTHYEQRFNADQTTPLAPVSSGGVDIGGVAYTGYALGRYVWEANTTCTDLSDIGLWALWRSP